MEENGTRRDRTVRDPTGSDGTGPDEAVRYIQHGTRREKNTENHRWCRTA